MYDPNAAYDLAWAPKRYPAMRKEDEGVWRLVLDESDDPIGVVWTNYSDGAGVLWVTQTPEAEKLLRHFQEAVLANVPAGYAYHGSELVPGVKLGAEFSGPLTGVLEELEAIADETS